MSDDYESVDNEKSWECIDGIFFQSKDDQKGKLEKKPKIDSKLKGKFPSNNLFFTIGMNKNEIFKEKNVQKTFQPYQVLLRKRTKDAKTQTGPWPNFAGPFFVDINHQGKVSLIFSGSITLISIDFL